MGVVAKDFTIAKNDGVQSYGNLVQLVESPKQAGVLYAGSDDGTVQRDARTAGKTWTQHHVTLPRTCRRTATCRASSPRAHDANTVYASFDNHTNDDYNNYVYASVDGGNNFRSISEGHPEGTGRR